MASVPTYIVEDKKTGHRFHVNVSDFDESTQTKVDSLKKAPKAEKPVDGSESEDEPVKPPKGKGKPKE